jgi:hypothetical protein
MSGWRERWYEAWYALDDPGDRARALNGAAASVRKISALQQLLALPVVRRAMTPASRFVPSPASRRGANA